MAAEAGSAAAAAKLTASYGVNVDCSTSSCGAYPSVPRGSLPASASPNRTVPRTTSPAERAPAMALSRVVLPEPEGPMRAHREAGGSEPEAGCTMYLLRRSAAAATEVSVGGAAWARPRQPPPRRYTDKHS